MTPSPLPRAAALLLVVFALAGCREYVVDPGIQPPAEQEEVPFITLKGPGEVRPGQLADYRAQSAPGAVRYVFQLTSPSNPVMQSVDTNDDRYLNTEVIGVGTVEVRVTAFDADGEPVARSARTVVSVQP